MSRTNYLQNRHIIIERDFRRQRSQRFKFWWDNPMGTESHVGYAATLFGALAGAMVRKLRAELSEWQSHRRVRRWVL